MARIPTVEGRNVREQALQGGEQSAQAPRDAFTGQAENLGRMGEALGQVSDAADRIHQRQAQDQAYRAETAIKSEWIEYQHEMRRARRNSAAEGVTNEAEEWWAEARQRHGDNMSPMAQRLARNSLTAAWQQGIDSTRQWELDQLDRSERESYHASQAVEIQRAATSGDPAVARTARDQIRERAYQQAATQNWTGEQVEAEILEWESQLHTQMVNQLMDTDPDAARAYYEANRSEVDASLQPRIDAALKDAQATKHARELVDSLSGLDFNQQMERIRSIDDDATREKARAFARQDQADLSTARQQVQQQAHDRVWQMAANGAKLEDLPQSQLAMMRGSDRMQLQNYYNKKAEAARRRERGLDIETHPPTRNYLTRMQIEQPTQFAELDLSEYQYHLSPSDMLSLTKAQANLRSPDDAQTYGQLLSDVSNRLDLDSDDAALLSMRFHEAVAEHHDQHSRNPNNREARDILDVLVAQERGRLWGARGYLFEIDPRDQERVELFVQRIHVPDAAERDIRRRYKERTGTEPTTEEVQELYRDELGLE